MSFFDDMYRAAENLSSAITGVRTVEQVRASEDALVEYANEVEEKILENWGERRPKRSYINNSIEEFFCSSSKNSEIDDRLYSSYMRYVKMVTHNKEEYERYKRGAEIREKREEEQRRKEQEHKLQAKLEDEKRIRKERLEINHNLRQELQEIAHIEPLYIENHVSEMNFVRPDYQVVAYGMVEVYRLETSDSGVEQKTLIWQGVQHLLLNDLKKNYRRMVCIYEDEEIESLLERYKADLRWDYDNTKDYETELFLKSKKYSGIMDKQISYNHARLCKLNTMKLVMSVDDYKGLNITSDSELSIDKEDDFIERYRIYCKRLNSDELSAEQRRITFLLKNITQKFSYPPIANVELLRMYSQAQDVIDEIISTPRKKTDVSMWGNKGEQNVDYHLKWLGSDFKSIEKDCINKEKNTILLMKSDFIDEKQELDHILISKHGIYIIETKYLKGKIQINQSGNWIRIDNDNKVGMSSPVAQVDRHHALVYEILKDIVTEKDIHDIICLSHESSIVEGEENCPIPIVKMDMLTRYIKEMDTKNIESNYDVNVIIERINQYKVK